MVLSQAEFDFAYSSGLNKIQELFAERNKTQSFFHQCLCDREIQIHYGFQSGERNFNNEVTHNPLNYLNEAPVDGPGYDSVPESFRFEKSFQWEHCKECYCQEAQPDFPMHKCMSYWLDQHYLAVMKLFLQPVLEENHRTIQEHGKFICKSNHFESPVMTIYGPGEEVICNQDELTFIYQIEGSSTLEFSDGSKTLEQYRKNCLYASTRCIWEEIINVVEVLQK
ncbi:uncharacterized protein LOC136030028 isoform X2 [Artemia franciscana]|uniref:uncharacterized protein LOC136030028 isoform X2 n=1 Tax=Artemia franciscana TaxID=6661 RepID=UPI0032DBA214